MLLRLSVMEIIRALMQSWQLQCEKQIEYNSVANHFLKDGLVATDMVCIITHATWLHSACNLLVAVFFMSEGDI